MSLMRVFASGEPEGGKSPRPHLGLNTSSNSLRMSSTIWFWKTMFTVMLPVSVWGRSNVGPNTMAVLWTDIRFASPFSITLERGEKKRECGVCVYESERPRNSFKI